MDDAYQKEIELILTGTTWKMPPAIGEWLGRLLLLYGVPFNYLVPDETMLPPGSIRFFYLDPGWMKCLLEGASSIGKSSSVDEVFDQRLRNKFLDLAGEKATEVRAGEGGTLYWPLTGFLLRSELVAGWQGLEMKASGVVGQGQQIVPLQTLRIDRLSPDIMFCLFNGKVTEIEIKQPPEGLHFGAAPDGHKGYQKIHLRKLTPAEEAGDQIQQTFDIAVPLREGSARVVNVQALANQIEQALRGEKAIESVFTSAEFAVQMVESPGRALFSAPKNAPKGNPG